MAAPFYNQVFDFLQPDGTPFQVRGSGNQYRASFETLDGFAVLRDAETGFFYHARRDDQGALVRVGAPLGSAKGGLAEVALDAEKGASAFVSDLDMPPMAWQRRYRAQRGALESLTKLESPKRTTTGDYLGVCLLAQFKGEPRASITRDQVEAFCNAPGPGAGGNIASVHEYFHGVSRGRLNYRTIVAPFFTAKRESDYYTDPHRRYGERGRELVIEGLEAARASGVPLGDLTADENGHVYAVNLLYTTPAHPNTWAVGLWPHAGNTGQPVRIASGKTAFDYQITTLKDVPLGAYCHENGHMLCAFPDLYDTDSYTNSAGEKVGEPQRGVGYFCAMGSATWNVGPGEICAYLKYRAGWCDPPQIMKPGATIEVRAADNAFAIHALNDAEYFIVEHRARSGWDRFLPHTGGLAIWHVDERGSNNNQIQSPNSHYECALVQADGAMQIERNDSRGDEGDLFKPGRPGVFFDDNSTPHARWWSGAPSGLKLANLRAINGGLAFDVL